MTHSSARSGHTERARAEQMVMQKGQPTEAFEWFKVDWPIGNV